jgi:hypothetical protein
MQTIRSSRYGCVPLPNGLYERTNGPRTCRSVNTAGEPGESGMSASGGSRPPSGSDSCRLCRLGTPKSGAVTCREKQRRQDRPEGAPAQSSPAQTDRPKDTNEGGHALLVCTSVHRRYGQNMDYMYGQKSAFAHGSGPCLVHAGAAGAMADGRPGQRLQGRMWRGVASRSVGTRGGLKHRRVRAWPWLCMRVCVPRLLKCRPPESGCGRGRWRALATLRRKRHTHAHALGITPHHTSTPHHIIPHRYHTTSRCHTTSHHITPHHTTPHHTPGGLTSRGVVVGRQAARLLRRHGVLLAVVQVGRGGGVGARKRKVRGAGAVGLRWGSNEGGLSAEKRALSAERRAQGQVRGAATEGLRWVEAGAERSVAG